MKPSMLIITALAAGLSVVALASRGGADPASETRDRLFGPIDPFHAGAQRAMFLRAAGVDNAMDEVEFEADQRRPDSGSFVQRHERWQELIRFDADRNGRIDWFEASEYRFELRRRLLARFDADDDGRLSGAERSKAIEALSGVAVRPAEGPRDAAAAPLAASDPARDPDEDPDAGDREGPVDTSELNLPNRPEVVPDHARKMLRSVSAAHRRHLDRFDADGDGKVTPQEWRAQKEREAMTAFQELLEKYDADGNGRIDESEYTRYRAERQQRVESAFDADGDGQLSPKEAAQWRTSDAFAHWDRFDRADRDRNGILDVDEQEAYAKLWESKPPTQQLPIQKP